MGFKGKLSNISKWVTNWDSLKTSPCRAWPPSLPRRPPPPSSVSSCSSRIRMRWSVKAAWTSRTMASSTVRCEPSRVRVSTHCGEEIWPIACVTSRRKLSTSPSRIRSRRCSTSRRTPPTPRSSPPTSCPAVWRDPSPSCSSTLSITPEPVWPTTPRARVRASIQGSRRRLHQDHQIRRRPRSLQRIRHFLRRHFRLPWDVLRPLRFPEAHSSRTRCWVVAFLLLGIRCHRHFRLDVLPHRHRSSSHDDDLRNRRQVQGLHRLLPASREERGLHVLDEGRGRQYSSRRRRRRCPRRFRLLQEALHRMAQGAIILGSKSECEVLTPLGTVFLIYITH